MSRIHALHIKDRLNRSRNQFLILASSLTRDPWMVTAEYSTFSPRLPKNKHYCLSNNDYIYIYIIYTWWKNSCVILLHQFICKAQLLAVWPRSASFMIITSTNWMSSFFDEFNPAVADLVLNSEINLKCFVISVANTIWIINSRISWYLSDINEFNTRCRY